MRLAGRKATIKVGTTIENRDFHLCGGHLRIAISVVTGTLKPPAWPVEYRQMARSV
jgi:hypothetical protein